MKITAETLKEARLKTARIEDLADGDVFYDAITLEMSGNNPFYLRKKQGKLIKFADNGYMVTKETVEEYVGEDIYIPVKQA